MTAAADSPLVLRLLLRRSGERTQDGYTLIETVAALVVFAIAAVAIVALLTSSLTVSRKNRQRVQAAQVAAQAIETARDAVKNSLPIADDATQQITVGSTVFSVTTHASWTNVGATGSLCTGAVPGDVAYRRIAASVRWPNMSGTPAVTSTTVATPLDPDSITIPVQLVAADKSPLAGQTITLTPPTGAAQTATTDTNGCVVFAQLVPQKYTVSVNVMGYVDATSNAATSHTEQVGQSVPGVTPLVTIFYDHPATLSLSPAFSTGFSSGYPLPVSALADTIQQTGWSDGSSHSYSASGFALSRTVFPFRVAPGSGYAAFAGDCPTDALMASSALGVPVPNGTSSLALPVVSRVITITRSGTTQGGVTVKAANSPDGCADSYTLSGTTATSGTTKGQIKFSVPAGDYIFSAVISGTTRSSGSVAVTSSSSTPITVALS